METTILLLIYISGLMAGYLIRSWRIKKNVIESGEYIIPYKSLPPIVKKLILQERIKFSEGIEAYEDAAKLKKEFDKL